MIPIKQKSYPLVITIFYQMLLTACGYFKVLIVKSNRQNLLT